MNTLIQNVLVHNEVQDILIEKNIIKKIAKHILEDNCNIVNGTDKLAIPPFYNTHTHAGMTLMRGYSDDLHVHQWLEKKIWPFEKNMSEEDVYIGSKLACLEMIKTGTVYYNDMYWFFHGMARAADEMGLRASICAVLIDMFDSETAKQQREVNEALFKEAKKYSDRVQFAIGPHAIYTVSEESLRWCSDFANENNVMINIHLSETHHEVEECIKKHGKRPIEYLKDIGFLGSNVIAAHCIWLDDNEIDILKDHEVILSHNPTSNMKLSSGVFPYEKLHKKNIKMTLGTDGCASNNNLDMLEEMKFASCKAKLDSMNPTLMNAEEIFNIATRNGAEYMKINGGVLEEGKVADIVLIDLNNTMMVPRHNIISNLVYSATSACIDTTICDGKILMENGRVDGEEEIIALASEAAMKLTEKM